jgi:hypothetical protein
MLTELFLQMSSITCGVAVNVSKPKSINPFTNITEVSASGAPSSIPGMIWE